MKGPGFQSSAGDLSSEVVNSLNYSATNLNQPEYQFSFEAYHDFPWEPLDSNRVGSSNDIVGL